MVVEMMPPIDNHYFIHLLCNSCVSGTSGGGALQLAMHGACLRNIIRTKGWARNQDGQIVNSPLTGLADKLSLGGHLIADRANFTDAEWSETSARLAVDWWQRPPGDVLDAAPGILPDPGLAAILHFVQAALSQAKPKAAASLPTMNAMRMTTAPNPSREFSIAKAQAHERLSDFLPYAPVLYLPNGVASGSFLAEARTVTDDDMFTDDAVTRLYSTDGLIIGDAITPDSSFTPGPDRKLVDGSVLYSFGGVRLGPVHFAPGLPPYKSTPPPPRARKPRVPRDTGTDAAPVSERPPRVKNAPRVAHQPAPPPAPPKLMVATASPFEPKKASSKPRTARRPPSKPVTRNAALTASQ